MPRRSTSREDLPFDAPPGGFGEGRTATETSRYRSAQRAYKAGRKGRGFSMDTADPLSYDELREFYEQGRNDADERTPSPPPTDAPDAAPSEPAAGPPPRPAPARPRARGGGAPQIVNDGAGFVLGLVGYGLFINFLRGGRAQARGWVAAKFLNRPYTPPAAPVIGPSHGSGFGGGLTPGSTGGLTPPTTTGAAVPASAPAVVPSRPKVQTA
jgi:hypothetical protein